MTLSETTTQTQIGSKRHQKSIYASIWRRLSAMLIDEVIWLLGSGVLLSIIFLLSMVVLRFTNLNKHLYEMIAVYYFSPALFTATIWLYFTAMESSQQRATFGKKIMGISVADVNLKQITFARANARFWGKLLSDLLFGLGFLMPVFTAKKQALHDFIAGTVVINNEQIGV